MDHRTLQAVGLALFGVGWQRQLARALGRFHPDGARHSIDDRLVRRWNTAAVPIPGWVAPALLQLTATQIRLLEAAERRIRAGQ